MRAGTVLVGMLVAAIAALLVWFDATGQLRPFLSASPMVVFDLAPTAADPADAAQHASLDAPAIDPAPAAAATEPAADAESSGDPVASGSEPELESDVESGADTAIEAAVPAPEAATADDTTEANSETEFAAAAEAAAPDEAATDEAANDTTVEAPIALDPSDEAAVSANSATDEPDMASAAAVTDVAAASVGDAPAPPPEKPAEQTAEAAENAATETVASDGTASDTASTRTAALPAVPSGAELPWRRYAGDFPIADPRPRIAIVFTSLGLSDAAGDAIILHMPPGVTLAFSPYSRKLTEWIARAREDGHEALIELPMEPLNYPDDDPGPLALLSTLPVQDNITRMDGILARADGVVGVAALMGSRFTTSSELMRPLLTALGERGYVYVDNNAAPFSVLPTLAGEIAVQIAINNHYIDREASRIAIDGRLQQIERIARSEGAAVAF
ncbi:MAG: divergent polysaccharide deacetylase family protein, partial [Dongiaceae bacterium]